jgi:hypothetical protein
MFIRRVYYPVALRRFEVVIPAKSGGLFIRIYPILIKNTTGTEISMDEDFCRLKRIPSGAGRRSVRS